MPEEGEDRMIAVDHDSGWSRRDVLTVGATATAFIACPKVGAAADDEAMQVVERVMGKRPTLSERVRLDLPRVFPNGYTVPLALAVDSPMTSSDHVRYVRVLAPKNPLIEVATFHFMPGRSRAHVATRIRLAEPQFVIAVAAMNDESLLMAKTWVQVTTNGCK